MLLSSTSAAVSLICVHVPDEVVSPEVRGLITVLLNTVAFFSLLVSLQILLGLKLTLSHFKSDWKHHSLLEPGLTILSVESRVVVTRLRL